ncbi:hypothetical protein FOY91_18365 [Sphingomonas solaris]|uniref:Anti-sigma factor n=1 Tax=Alterirhizorhabdus solaris TaxID=2529389 RepID=A0A558QUC7_9SPHN|nr:hypothetical protein FOY91_18365 [Sphingomonas solaris]
MALAGGGWAASTLATDRPMTADRETIVDEALESNEATMVRVAMRSQVETPTFDPAEIASATAIHLPRFPAGWRITDVQIYPSDAGPGVQIAIRTEQGKALTLLALRSGVLAGLDGAMPRLERHGVQSVAYWNDGAADIALVSRESTDVLGRLATQLAPVTQGRVAEPR